MYNMSVQKAYKSLDVIIISQDIWYLVTCVNNALRWIDQEKSQRSIIINTNYTEGRKKSDKIKYYVQSWSKKKGCHNLNFLMMNISPSCSSRQIPCAKVLRGLWPRSSGGCIRLCGTLFQENEELRNPEATLLEKTRRSGSWQLLANDYERFPEIQFTQILILHFMSARKIDLLSFRFIFIFII